MSILPRACAQSVWLQLGLMYMIIESDDVQTNRELEPTKCSTLASLFSLKAYNETVKR